MKYYTFFAGLLITLCSCQNDMRDRDTTQLNQQLAKESASLTPTQVMQFYYHSDETEGNSRQTIDVKEMPDNFYEITLIHENLPDDSQAALKLVMLAQKTERYWIVRELREAWKCREGRGSTDWGVELCE